MALNIIISVVYDRLKTLLAKPIFPSLRKKGHIDCMGIGFSNS